jgi:hypothetical protein
LRPVRKDFAVIEPYLYFAPSREASTKPGPLESPALAVRARWFLSPVALAGFVTYAVALPVAIWQVLS